jgi:hypothetical protein
MALRAYPHSLGAPGRRRRGSLFKAIRPRVPSAKKRLRTRLNKGLSELSPQWQRMLGGTGKGLKA